MEILKKVKDSIMEKKGLYIAFYLIFISSFITPKNITPFIKAMPVIRCVFIAISFFMVYGAYKNLKLTNEEEKRLKGSVSALIVLEVVSLFLVFRGI